ncbi:DUF397 domain-containing protein [Streptomyces carpaticus]|uniref:DUF397 domain-containing protein n=1 Tax=Streptomyces TaxID=1883 RepID=UPI001FF88588|nr:DUF397 domain-containing protein [Streptomyces sp. XM4011]MCK1814786.1 DUF397 domain-containing protein [Streptomyces sp. XM4011]UWM50783.1 DUF397 domain-containing protein [Streptomyces carpaticus]
MNSEAGATTHLTHAQWRKPRRSQANGNCVEVADGISGHIPIRDSKLPQQVLLIPAPAWRALISHLRA